MKTFHEKLRQLEDRARLRSLKLPSGIDLTSNDTLGMASHEGLRAAAIEFLLSGENIGARGSRLLHGHTRHHADLEDFAAAHFSAPKTLYFSSGFQANTAIFQTLPDRRDTIIFDALIHASARDGIQNSVAQHRRVAHNDLEAYEQALKNAQGRRWIAVESVYSMEGDTAPLEELYALACRYDAVLVVDEAHATGVLGEQGKGLTYMLARTRGYERLITLHTCGKAIGVAGGLVCASAEIIDYMINAARPFIYSTAPLPLQAFLVRQSLEILAGAEGEKRRQKLRNLSREAQTLFGGYGTHIVPIILGPDQHAVSVAEMLQQSGFDIRAIRPPTVPEGSARLRLSLSSSLEDNTLKNFAAAFMLLQRDVAA